MIEFLSWDSDFFGVRVGRVPQPVDSPSMATEILGEFEESDLELLYAWVPLSVSGVLEVLLQRPGSLLTDIRAETELSLSGHAAGDLSRDGLDVREAQAMDLEGMLRIARRCYRGLTRFYRDPGLSDEKCDEFYSIWVARDMEDPGSLCMVCTEEDRVVGFCTSSPVGPDSARLGLIGVSTEARGRGAGDLLLRGTASFLESRGVRRLTAVTQLASAGAFRMYQRTGFLLVDSAAGVHLWRGGDRSK